MSTGPRRTVEAPTVNESPFPSSSDDPTATKTIRNRYGAEMYRRFRALKSAIIEGVVERDAFGIADLSPEERAGPRTPASFADTDYAANPLGPPSDPERFESFDECVAEIAGDGTSEAEAEAICGSWEGAKNADLEAAQDRTGGAGAGINIEPPSAGEFAYPSDQRKVEEFLGWLARQEQRGILGVDPTSSTRELAAAEAWQNTYLRQAYSKGVTHADAFLVQAGVIPRSQVLDDAFRAVRHSDAAGLVFTRAYNELDGVTDAMSQQMGRVLAEGLTQGLNPNEIARQLNDRVENVGLHRGRMIARTETVRAHNEAALNRYEDMDARIEGVTTLAEHMTAGDNRVCDECQVLEGALWSIREARGRIPVHPNCRCTWVPVPDTGQPHGPPSTNPVERVDAFYESVADLDDDEQVARVSEWLSENTKYGTDRGGRAVTLNDLDPERTRAVANVMMKMEHADLLGPLNDGWLSDTTAHEIRGSPGKAQALAWAKGNNVTFNADLFTEERLSRLRDAGWLTGRFARTPFSPVEAGVVHEFGHVFHHNALLDRAGTRVSVRNGRFSPRMADSIGGKISRYAATNPAEFVAESFVRIAYDLPMSPEHQQLYRRYAGPDPDIYRGFMLDDDVAANMDEQATGDDADVATNVERTDVGDFPEDLPPELRAEAEAVYEGMFGDDADGE